MRQVTQQHGHGRTPGGSALALPTYNCLTEAITIYMFVPAYNRSVLHPSFLLFSRLIPSWCCTARCVAGCRLPLPVALKYSIDIVKGLVELHRLGVIAADLKPDNVLIDEELGDAVIADFGISSVVTTTIGNTGRGSAVRSSGAMRGTPNYM